jgi:predicted aconitase with swiveling domain
VAEGEALVTNDTIMFSEVDAATGVLPVTGHELMDECLAGKILVFPSGGPCTGSSYVLYELSKRGVAPSGLVNVNVEPISTVGAILAKIPMIDRTDRNPLEFIESGDHVVMDGDSGTIEVTKRS